MTSDPGRNETGAPASAWVRRIVAICLGWTLMGTAIAALLASGAGASPYDVFNSGLSRLLGIQVGTASWFAGAALIALATVLGAPPRKATFAGILVLGAIINWTLPQLPRPDHNTGMLLEGTLGLAGMLAGISLVVASGLGAGPIELVMLGLNHRGLPVPVARWTLEGTLVALGIVMHGAFGVLTVVTTLVSGPVLNRTIPAVRKHVRRDS